jgi:hypothetical protein
MPKRTAMAKISWVGTCAVIDDVIRPADDDVILGVIEQADKIGIDCPFGWPDTFVQFVAAHHVRRAGLPKDGVGAAWRQELTMRRIDVFVRDKLQGRAAERLGGQDRARGDALRGLAGTA